MPKIIRVTSCGLEITEQSQGPSQRGCVVAETEKAKSASGIPGEKAPSGAAVSAAGHRRRSRRAPGARVTLTPRLIGQMRVNRVAVWPFILGSSCRHWHGLEWRNSAAGSRTRVGAGGWPSLRAHQRVCFIQSLLVFGLDPVEKSQSKWLIKLSIISILNSFWISLVQLITRAILKYKVLN